LYWKFGCSIDDIGLYFGSIRFAHREDINPLNAELNPICHMLALLGAHHILHVSRVRVNYSNFSGWLLFLLSPVNGQGKSLTNYQIEAYPLFMIICHLSELLYDAWSWNFPIE
jgi:hypothetical protein